MTTNNESETQPNISKTPAKRGRPKKTQVEKRKPGSRGKVGRPKGDAAILNEYKARMLASPKSKKVLETIFDAALDPDHKAQAAAWKLVMDRIAPVSSFEADIKRTGGKSGVTINISGIGEQGVTIDGSEDAEDGDFVEGETIE